jgi:hypothetical protein
MSVSKTNRTDSFNQYRKFLFCILLFLSIVAVLDFSVGKVLKYFYFKQKTGYQYRINYALNQSKADIYILGSSRAMHHYDPLLITQKTGMKCYNAGENGMNLLYSYLIFNGIIERHNPQIFILELNVDDFIKTETSYDRLSVMLPYYNAHPEFSEILYKRSKLEKLKLVSQIYPFNSDILQIIYGNIAENNAESKSKDFEGYIPLTGEWDKAHDVLKNLKTDKTDTFKLQKFEEMIRIAQKKNIRMVITVSPVYGVCEKPLTSIILAEEICKKHNVPFLINYQNKYFLTRPFLFKDPSHLNKKGAELLTYMLIDQINKERIALNK